MRNQEGNKRQLIVNLFWLILLFLDMLSLLIFSLFSEKSKELDEDTKPKQKQRTNPKKNFVKAGLDKNMPIVELFEPEVAVEGGAKAVIEEEAKGAVNGTFPK